MHEGRRPGEFLYDIWLPGQQVEMEFVSPNELRFKELDDIQAHYLKLRLREDELARRQDEKAELTYREQLSRRNFGQRDIGGRQHFVRSEPKPDRTGGRRHRASRDLAPPTSGGWGKFLAEFAYALSLDKRNNDEVDLKVVSAPPEIVKDIAMVFADQPTLDEKEELDQNISDFEHRNSRREPIVKGNANGDDIVANPQVEAMKSRERGRRQDRVIHIDQTPANVVFDIDRLRDVSHDGNLNFHFILNSKN